MEYFEDDDIEDFPGHDLMETETYDYMDDQTWLFPPKGPGEFAHLKNKNKKKKAKGKKKKQLKGKKKAGVKTDL